jgi:hypothetical protein
MAVAFWPGLFRGPSAVRASEFADLGQLARQAESVHRFSTLFTAQDVRQRLSSEEGLRQALDWCQQTAVTKVYIEEFRDGYQADRETIQKAKERFRRAGFAVSGCVTPTKAGKSSTGWKETISCYTDLATQDRIQSIFEYAAGLFDEIMIDDFWFTDCACPECDAARLARQVTIGKQVYSVDGDTWEAYRGELMTRLSQDRLLKAAQAINPNVKLIIKFPQWYESFHERGYDVLRETAAFDRIWAGTESRDYNDAHWGGTAPYESYFIMRWLGGIGGPKCGGGWYDWLGTTERTYLEQARQTILAGAPESMLFCYGGLQGSTGPRDIAALRANIPELLQVAKQVHGRAVIGVAAYKPANSHAENEKRVFDFVGMLGLPLVPCHEFPTDAPAAFFSVHALKDPRFTVELAAYVESGKPVLLTDGLRQRLEGKLDLGRPNVHILRVNGDPKSLLAFSDDAARQVREPLLRPLGIHFLAPNRVGLYWFGEGSWVVENFNDHPVKARINEHALTLPARGWAYQWP